VSPDAFPSPGGLFAPLSPLLEQIPFAPDPASLDLLMAPLDLRTGSGRRLRFVPPPGDGLDYEMRIWERGEVVTRPDNWHDFFNALVWCTFPLAKAALNARHAAALTVQPAIRGSDRDALTHFDECGVVVVASDPSLLALLRGFQWRALFWTRRHDLARTLRCFVFGHATYESTCCGRSAGLTAKAVLYEVTADWLCRQTLSMATVGYRPAPGQRVRGWRAPVRSKCLAPAAVDGAAWGHTRTTKPPRITTTSGNSGRGVAHPAYNQAGKSVRQPLGKRCRPRAERKVRAPQSRMPVNDRAP
jgi:hypothetical protein